MPSGRASSAPFVRGLLSMAAVTALGAVACADGTLPALGANDPASPTAAEAPFQPASTASGPPVAPPAAPDSSPHAHHHHEAP